MGAESGHRGEAIYMQGLMVVGFVVDEILRVGFKYDNITLPSCPFLGLGETLEQHAVCRTLRVKV